MDDLHLDPPARPAEVALRDDGEPVRLVGRDPQPLDVGRFGDRRGSVPPQSRLSRELEVGPAVAVGVLQGGGPVDDGPLGVGDAGLGHAQRLHRVALVAGEVALAHRGHHGGGGQDGERGQDEQRQEQGASLLPGMRASDARVRGVRLRFSFPWAGDLWTSSAPPIHDRVRVAARDARVRSWRREAKGQRERAGPLRARRWRRSPDHAVDQGGIRRRRVDLNCAAGGRTQRLSTCCAQSAAGRETVAGLSVSMLLKMESESANDSLMIFSRISCARHHRHGFFPGVRGVAVGHDHDLRHPQDSDAQEEEAIRSSTRVKPPALVPFPRHPACPCLRADRQKPAPRRVHEGRPACPWFALTGAPSGGGNERAAGSTKRWPKPVRTRRASRSYRHRGRLPLPEKLSPPSVREDSRARIFPGRKG